jgi:hypothetical protein
MTNQDSNPDNYGMQWRIRLWVLKTAVGGSLLRTLLQEL